MNEALNNWLDIKAQEEVDIWCEDPEQCTESVSSFFGIEKSYLTYRILMKQTGRDLVGVRHRYSEFEDLRKTLSARYVKLGMLVPSLPPKKPVSSLTKNSNDIFIKERTQGLSMFCEAIAQNPFIKSDHKWIEFMKPKMDSTINGYRNRAESNEGELVGVNPGESKLMAALEQLKLVAYKYSFVQRVNDVKEEAKLIERNINTTIEKLRHIQSLERQLYSAQESLHDSFHTWSGNETNSIRQLGGFGYDSTESDIDNQEAVTTSLKELSLYHINLNIAVKNNADYRGCLVIACLEHELARIESIRELCKVHDDMLKEIETASRDGKSIQFVSSLESTLHIFYKGFFLYSLPMTSKQRASNLRKITSSLASIMLSSTSRIYLDTLKFFENLSFSTMESMKVASHSLDLISLQPLQQLNELPSPVNEISTKKFNNTHYFTSEGFKLVKPSLASQYASQIKSSITKQVNNTIQQTTSVVNKVIDTVTTNEVDNVVNSATNTFVNIDLNKSEPPPPPPQSVKVKSNETTKALLSDLLGEDNSKKNIRAAFE